MVENSRFKNVVETYEWCESTEPGSQQLTVPVPFTPTPLSLRRLHAPAGQREPQVL